MIPERPLLLFPTPEIADRSKGHGFPSHLHRPSHARQGRRLSPIFRQLQAEFDARRAELMHTAAAADPEQVLVIETIGNVKDFAAATKRIPGFEWMGEIAIDEIQPDDDFHDERNAAKELSGRLYLVMTNQQALSQLLSLWHHYQNNPKMAFDHGLARFREVFLNLKDIRRWGVRERFEETGIFDAWLEDLQHDGDRPIRFEIELWFREISANRREAFDQVNRLIGQLGGNLLQDCVIPDIAYHAMLAEIPANAAQLILDHPDVDLIKCDSIMFFRPLGQMTTGKHQVEGEILDHNVAQVPPPIGKPIVAILDGLPLANHALLDGRIIIDDPDDFASSYTVPDQCHGTAMVSLVVHGDLSDDAPPLSRPVYVRPIMSPIPWIDSPRPERIPDDVLVVDYIHRAVRRMFEGEGTQTASAPTIRIINFSIGDASRQFTRALSPLARLLDWLSLRYRVLFVISAGNHQQQITTGTPKAEFDKFTSDEKEAIVVKALYRDARLRRILSPGESINSITVGALHCDNAGIINVDPSMNLFQRTLPSPVSAFGSGHRRAIKPDLLFNGGRVLYREILGTRDDKAFECSIARVAPGNKVASPSPFPGDLNKVVYCCGTSNATALVSRMASRCHDALADVFEDQAPDIDISSYIAPLLKAMLVHSCSWGETGARLQDILNSPHNDQQVRDWIVRWLGYGVPNCDRVLECTEQRATLLGFGQLQDKEAHVFDLPLPASLGARRERRRLTVTLAWLSPVLAKNQLYRSAGLWFEVRGDSLASDRKDADWQAVRRGTLQHEVFEGDRAIPIMEDTNLAIKVNCRRDAGPIREPVPYGLVVSLEVAEGVGIAIYDEIRARIASAIQIRNER